MATTSRALQTIFPKLAADHQKILTAKYTGQTFGQMSNEALNESAKIISTLISVMGAILLPEKNSAFIFYEKLGNRLKSEYQNLTVKEVELAVEENINSIKNYYNKPISFQVIEDILQLYFVKRNEATAAEMKAIDFIEEQKVVDLEQIKFSSRHAVENDYQDYLKGSLDFEKDTTFHINYDTLISDKLVDNVQQNYLLSKGIYKLKLKAQKQLQAAKEIQVPNDSKHNIEFAKQRKIREIQEAQQYLNVIVKIENEAKKLALIEYYAWCKKNNKSNIYV